jgi:hypothetical protein
MSKKTVLNQITTFRGIGDRDGAIDLWSRYKNLISKSEFEQAYGKGMEIFYAEETE